MSVCEIKLVYLLVYTVSTGFMRIDPLGVGLVGQTKRTRFSKVGKPSIHIFHAQITRSLICKMVT